MVNDDRRKSYHEQYATEKYQHQQPIKQSTRVENKPVSTVMERILKFEKSSMEQRKFVYLQPEERKTPIVYRVEGVDRGVQTEDDEHGQIEGDEEWFMNDIEWEDQDEILIVEWLLGE
jgi:hypothetical protein